MDFVGIILGLIIILSAMVVTTGVVAQKDTNKGLSAAISGAGNEIGNKAKDPSGAVWDKGVIIGMTACMIATVVLGIMAVAI